MNPLLLEFPEEFTTERLVIRAPKPGDGKAIYEAAMASLNDLRAWLPFAQKELTEKDMELNIREAHINFQKREDLRWLVFLKDTGQFVASSGLHRVDWTVRKFEIGYWIDSRLSGKGYMTEAAQGISDFAFNELKANRVEIRCDELNVKSRAIPEKLGYTLEGILKKDSLAVKTGELRNTCVYARTV